MARDDSQERTEEATEKRLRESREKGQITRSKELNTMVVMFSAALISMALGQHIATGLQRVYRECFTLTKTEIFDPSILQTKLIDSIILAGETILPFLLLVTLFALIGPTLLGGIVFSTDSFMPKLERLEPIKGLKKIFSWKTLIELIKALLKFGLVATTFVVIMKVNIYKIFALDDLPFEISVNNTLDLLQLSFLLMCISLIVITMIDVPFQLWDHARQLKMSKQEVKDEMKDTEGKPEVKGKIRRMQQEISKRRMMSQVPEADVIITNPTHFAVAIKYCQYSMNAPVVVAKGADLIAEMIRKIGKEHKIPLVSAPLLARSIYYTTEIEDEVPSGLYVAVAKILAYVYELKHYRPGRGHYPEKPTEFEIPDEILSKVRK